jgi:hypothetical protein
MRRAGSGSFEASQLQLQISDHPGVLCYFGQVSLTIVKPSLVNCDHYFHASHSLMKDGQAYGR